MFLALNMEKAVFNFNYYSQLAIQMKRHDELC